MAAIPFTNPTQISTGLERNKDVFRYLLTGLSKEQYTWQPAPGKWCLLEIICHLYDEEREDFRYRVNHILNTPDQKLPPIDPVGWVTSRKYMEQDYEEKLRAFLLERNNSIDWLHSLGAPKWDNVHFHPALGNISAEMMLSNWLAHDYLHFRQITRLKYESLCIHSGMDLSYAGSW